MSDHLAIIAGSRSLPLVIAREARKSGIARLIAIAFENETERELADLVDEVVWLRVGQLGKMISALKDRGITRCVMAGQIAPKNLFDLRPDLKAMLLLLKLKEKNAHSIFGAIADELAKAGIQLIEATPWLASVMPVAGFLLGPRLSAEQRTSIEYAFRIAKEISRLEIGQTVVVKNGTVLAVEGFEGTDRCLRRGGELAGNSGGAVAVKVAKLDHDMRFDIPCIVRTCVEAKIRALAIEGGKTLLLERGEVEELVRKHKLAVLALPLM
jgi:UDP-2,3-diacylglucosamine hydrolase